MKAAGGVYWTSSYLSIPFTHSKIMVDTFAIHPTRSIPNLSPHAHANTLDRAVRFPMIFFPQHHLLFFFFLSFFSLQTRKSTHQVPYLHTSSVSHEAVSVSFSSYSPEESAAVSVVRIMRPALWDQMGRPVVGKDLRRPPFSFVFDVSDS